MTATIDSSDQPRPAPGCVGAVFVTHHPDAGFADRVRRIVPQARAVLVVDNGSTDGELTTVRELVAGGAIEAILNERNRGLATALNQGLAWGEARGLAWVATFDQDTTPGDALVAEAGRVFDTHRAQPAAVLGAGWISGRGRPDCDDPGGVEVTHVITSGTLHSVAAWRALAGFRDDFFIDYVDSEYCLRARKAGYLVARSCVPTMSHAIGHPSRRWMLFRSVSPSNHSPTRRYYITRNRIRVWRSYWRREPGYVAYDMWAAIKELVKLLLFEDGRVAKLRAIAAGITDGMRREGEHERAPIR